jgi:hypothetical protein
LKPFLFPSASVKPTLPPAKTPRMSMSSLCEHSTEGKIGCFRR